MGTEDKNQNFRNIRKTRVIKGRKAELGIKFETTERRTRKTTIVCNAKNCPYRSVKINPEGNHYCLARFVEIIERTRDGNFCCKTRVEGGRIARKIKAEILAEERRRIRLKTHKWGKKVTIKDLNKDLIEQFDKLQQKVIEKLRERGLIDEED